MYELEHVLGLPHKHTTAEVRVPQDYRKSGGEVGKLDSYLPLLIVAAVVIGYGSTYLTEYLDKIKRQNSRE